MHVHVNALSFLIVAAYVVIFAAMWRWVASRNSENSFGQAMAVIL